MTEIQQNRWDRLIRRAAGIVGGGSQVNDTLNELFPTMEVENVPGELLALMGWRLGWCSSRLAPSALNRNHHQLFNPADSNVMLVVTKIATGGIATSQYRYTNFIGPLATLAGNERRRDTRSGILEELTGQNRTDQSTVNGGLDFRIRAGSGAEEFLTDPNGVVVLFPGTGVTVSTEDVNVETIVSFMWRERVFEPSELVP